MTSARSDPFGGRPLAISALMVLMAFSWTSVVVLPLLITAYVQAYHLSEPVAGMLSTVEIGALSLAAFLVSPTIHLMDKRRLCIVGCAAVGIGNGISCSFTSLWPFIVSRALVGAGEGLVVAATNALPAQARNGQRLYALGQVALGVGASLLIFASPLALARSPAQGVFWVEICASVITLCLALGLPPAITRAEEHAKAGRFPLNGAVLGALFSTMLFFIAQTALWAFADQVGAERGLADGQVDSYLGFSVLIGLVGSSTATWLGNRRGVLIPLVFGFLTVTVLGVAMYSIPSPLAFAAGVLLINVFIVFVTPYIFTVLAELDSYGRVASAGGAFTNLGNTLAPALSGLAAAYIGYSAIGYASAICLIAGLVCALPGARAVIRQRSRLQTPIEIS